MKVPSASATRIAGRVRLAGEPGAATVVEFGDVGGETHVIEQAPVEPGVEAAQGAGVGSGRVLALTGA